MFREEKIINLLFGAINNNLWFGAINNQSSQGKWEKWSTLKKRCMNDDRTSCYRGNTQSREQKRT